MGQPILVGYDPRTKHRAPVRLGVVLARFTEAPVIIASVQAPAAPRPIGLTPEQGLPCAVVPPDPDLLHDCAPQVEEIRLELEPHGIQADCKVLIGTSAAKALHEAAEEGRAGLLVVGSSRRSARGRVLAGAAARLLSGSPCPVAVAPRGWEPHELPKSIGVAFRDTEDGRAEIESWVGEPVDVLRRLTEHVDLLVCGSRGYGPVRAVLLGAVSRRIVTEARCPVAVLPRGRGSRLESLIAESRAAALA